MSGEDLHLPDEELKRIQGDLERAKPQAIDSPHVSPERYFNEHKGEFADGQNEWVGITLDLRTVFGKNYRNVVEQLSVSELGTTYIEHIEDRTVVAAA